jgi:single-stranded-DNA-specific exonuclease
MSVTGRRWRIKPKVPLEAVVPRMDLPPLIRHLLWHRGVDTDEEASRFLFLSSGAEHDPMLLPAMPEAVARLREAIRRGETVAVFGDFDVDGVTAAALLTEGLHDLGAQVVPYIPHRLTEGYGLTEGAVERLAQTGASVLISADCGTSSLAEVAQAGGLGMAVVILDHHSVAEELPAAVATVNPRRQDSRYPEKELTSVGLAYKAMSALYDSLGRPFPANRYLDLVALGTVADVAPLLGENRWLVKWGLEALAGTQRPGLQSLMQAAGLPPKRIDVESIAYMLGPRLNAAGRLAHARLAFDLFLVQREDEAASLALQLNALNQERQRQQAVALALVGELLAGEGPGVPFLFVGHREISAGIVGIVAGKLAEERYRPAIVYEQGEARSRGSGRSIPEYDITGALRTCGHLLLRFGGHRQAAGFTAETQHLPAVREALLEHAARELAGMDLSPAIDIDAALPLSGLLGQEIRWLARLEPYGQGNPAPAFLSRGVLVAEARRVGNDAQHLRLKLRDGPVTWPAIAFGLGQAAVTAGQRLDVVYSLGPDRAGDGALELRVRDLCASA